MERDLLGSNTRQQFIVSLVLHQRLRFKSLLGHRSCVTLCKCLHLCEFRASVCKMQAAPVGPPALPGAVHVRAGEWRLVHLPGEQLQSTLNISEALII